MHMLEKLWVMQPRSAVAVSRELECRCFSKNVAYICALELLKLLVLLA